MDADTLPVATDLPDLRDTPLDQIQTAGDGSAQAAMERSGSGDGKLPAAFFQSAV